MSAPDYEARLGALTADVIHAARACRMTPGSRRERRSVAGPRRRTHRRGLDSTAGGVVTTEPNPVGTEMCPECVGVGSQLWCETCQRVQGCARCAGVGVVPVVEAS